MQSSLLAGDCSGGRHDSGKDADSSGTRLGEGTDPEAYDETGYLCGETGCGLCALYQLRKAGITHLKLVGRGNYVDHMEKDIRNLRKALDTLETSKNEEEFQCTIKRTVFPHGCSGQCYYR